MTKQFRHAGVAFRYPDDWTLEPEDHDDGWGLSLYSPGTAFVTLRCYRSNLPIEELAETVLATMRQEYKQLDAEARVETIDGQMALGHDLEFLSLDASNLCKVRSIYTDAGTLLFLGQTSEIDPISYEPAINAILASLRFEDGETADTDEGP